MFRLYSRKVPRRFRVAFITDPKYLLHLANNSSLDMTYRVTQFNLTVQQLFIDGLWKKTHYDRLQTSTEIIPELLADKTKDYHFLDIGASDGSSSAYTHQYLTQKGYSLCTAATDKYTHILSNRRGKLEYFFTEDGRPFLCNMANTLMLRLYENKHRDPISKLLVSFVLNRFYEPEFLKDPIIIPLTNPIVTQIPSISFEKYDLFQVQPAYNSIFDLVRCSNILNLSYFSRSAIQSQIQTIKGYLKDGGYLIISKSDDDSPEAGTILKRINGNLEIIRDFSGGSEVFNLGDQL